MNPGRARPSARGSHGDPRWSQECQDLAGRTRMHHVEVTVDGLVVLLPPMVGVTRWQPDQVGRLIAALVEAQDLARRRREGRT